MPHTAQTAHSTGTFADLGISSRLLNVLTKRKFTTPTPIQAKVIPIALKGDDVIGIAQTGTGKTLAFVLPLLKRISDTGKQGLIIVPTRELAIQAEETVSLIGREFGVRTAVLIGGASMSMQLQAIRKHPHVIVATPGRLIDHLEQKTLSLKQVNTLVLDEADRMLDMGFAPQIKRVLMEVPKDRQTMLFSATMPVEISKIAKTHMHLPVSIEVAPQGTSAERVEQELFMVEKRDKIRLLEKLLEEYKGSVIVFTRTKHEAKRVAQQVRHMNHASVEIHADRSLAQRKEAMAGFKSTKYRVLVATDIAARGIDVTGIELVVNFDLPQQAEDYVHRIGRTGRAGRSGKAVSFATPDQGRMIRDIERLVRKNLSKQKLPTLPPARTPPPFIAASRPDRSSSRPSHRGSEGQSSYGRSRSSSRPSYSSSDSRPARSSGSRSSSPVRYTSEPGTRAVTSSSPDRSTTGDRPARSARPHGSAPRSKSGSGNRAYEQKPKRGPKKFFYGGSAL